MSMTRSEIARKAGLASQARMSPEQKHRRAILLGEASKQKMTTEQRREAGRKGGFAKAAKFIPKPKKPDGRATGWMKVPPETRRARSRKAGFSRAANLSKERLSEIGKLGGGRAGIAIKADPDKLKVASANLGKAREIYLSTSTSEERSDARRKSWITRKARAI